MKRIILLTAIVMGLPALLLARPPQQERSAQARGDRYWGEAYAFFGRRTGTPGTTIGGGGADLFIYKGLAVGGELGTTIGNPDDKITIGSIDGSYHFLCCRANRRVEPFAGTGYSWLNGDVKTPPGIAYPGSSNARLGPNFSQGLIVWATKHVGVRFEVQEYRMFVSYGALENVIPGGNPAELHIGIVFR